MSHFTVMVFGEDAEKQLAPFQENNMGNCPGEYMEFSDETDYINKEWGEEDQETRGQYNNDIEAYAADYHGYKKDEETGKYGYWENPNKKWDYYQLGGRWSGHFKLKAGSEGNVGRRGLFSSEPEAGYVDSARKCDIDFGPMRTNAAKEGEEKYDEVISIVGDSIKEMHDWTYVRQNLFSGEIELARDFYNSQIAPTRLKEWNSKNEYKNSFLNLEDFKMTREEYSKKCSDAAISSFAVIKDGVWYEKGEMGWWGITSDEKEQSDWNREFNDLLDSLPEETVISLYDCHI